jgi:radical SAM superfamily enzyme YgiQ (UPF0313 family)
MPDLLLAALNARYAHPSLGLRSLRANLGALRERSALLEFDLSFPPEAVAHALLNDAPRVLAFGVYVWNARPLAAVLEAVRRRSPRTRIVLGGPELAEEGIPEWTARADLLVCGEAEGVFEEACRGLLADRSPDEPTLHAPPPELAGIHLPDGEYSAEDLRHRVTYVESSRGCPFGCEYCLSSRDRTVRTFPDARVFESLDRLIRRGAQRFKFVDRTFNLDTERATAQLSFWLERLRPGLSVQYEAVPERFPPEIRALLSRFPPGALRLEIGVQTLDPRVSGTVGRRVDPARVEETFRFLREETRVDVHADLIAGLPGEGLAGFARSFNRLAVWRPAELQVGLLKRLRGTSIGRHDAAYGMRYGADPPYELIASACLDEEQVRRIKRFARYWDRMYNRGALREAVPLLWRDSGEPFESFLAFSDWAFERLGRDWGLPLDRLAGALAGYLQEVRRLPRARERVEEIWTNRAPRLKLPAP